MSYRVLKHGETIPLDKRITISTRYKTITKAINREFWKSTSDTLHSFYVGSYGRGTAINTSDIDLLVELPQSEYNRFDVYKRNGQSFLLQAVKNAIQSTYPNTGISADGQVVQLLFTDGMKVEVLPAFVITDWIGKKQYRYPDSNMGGNWRSTNPLSEQDAMKNKNASSNGLLFDTCKHIRFIRDNYFSSYYLSGIVIDSFVYAAIGNWRWLRPDESSSSSESGEYESYLYNYLNDYQYYTTIPAPGSGDIVDLSSSKLCLEKVLGKMCKE